MVDTPEFIPKKVLGVGLGKLTKAELLRLCERLCEIAVCQSGENGFRGGFRPGNIYLSDNDIAVGPADKAGEDGWTKDELEYMAPEVFWNGSKGPRADVYSIGLILYVGLNCGNVPFVPMADYNPTPDDRANALRRRMNGEEIPLPVDIDEELGSLVEKAISFNEAERFKDALELLNAIKIYCGEETVSEVPKGSCPEFEVCTLSSSSEKPAPEKEPAPEAKPAPEVKKEAKPAPEVKEAAKPDKASEPKDEASEPVQLKEKKRPTKYEKKSAKVRVVTIISIVLVLCAAAAVSELCHFTSFGLIPDSWKQSPAPVTTEVPLPSTPPTSPPSASVEPTPVTPVFELIEDDLSWGDAEMACRDMGGHLATISCEADYRAICKLLESTDAKYVWIGCYRSNTGVLTWTSDAKVDYYLWAPGEPSKVDSYDGTSENYIMLVRQTDGTWLYNDSRMDPFADYAKFYTGKMAYICQHG